MSRSSVVWTAARSANGCRRSQRAFSSPGVWAPRSMSTESTASSSGARVSVSSSRWRYFDVRLPAPLDRRAKRRRCRRVTASRIVVSS